MQKNHFFEIKIQRQQQAAFCAITRATAGRSWEQSQRVSSPFLAVPRETWTRGFAALSHATAGVKCGGIHATNI